MRPEFIPPWAERHVHRWKWERHDLCWKADIVGSPVPYTADAAPSVLVLQTEGNTVETNYAGFPVDIIQADAHDGNHSNVLTIFGDNVGEHVYLGDLAGAPADGDNFVVYLETLQGNTVVGGNANGDTVYTGLGPDYVTLGNGNGDAVILNRAGGGHGADQVVILGTGTGDSVTYGLGADHDSITVTGADASVTPGPSGGGGNYLSVTSTGADSKIAGGAGAYAVLTSTGDGDVFDDGTGAYMMLIGTGKHDTFNINQGPSDTVKAGVNATINVAAYASDLTITGTASDHLYFADSYANATGMSKT
jgi:hypothetical protein